MKKSSLWLFGKLQIFLYPGFWFPICMFLLIMSGTYLKAQDVPLKYSQIRIFIQNKEDISELQKAGVGLDHFNLQENYLDAVLNEIEIERVNCAPEQLGNGTNSQNAKQLFKGFAHHTYQGYGLEYVYVNKRER